MISIITSLYKSDRYLDSFSVQLKSFANFLSLNGISFELIAIANEPTDRERKFAQDFEKNNWFKFFSIAREPLYATWNRGVGMAFGEIIGFWNVDDVRYPEAVLEGLKLFSGGAELVYFPFKINRYLKIFGHYFLVHKQTIKDKIPEFNEKTKNDFLHQMNCGPFFMFTKKLYEKVGPFDEQFKIAGDFDWCVRAAKLPGNLVKAKSLAGEFRVDGGGLSAGGGMRQVVENNVIYRRCGFTHLIKQEDEELAKNYRLETILFNNQSIKLQ